MPRYRSRSVRRTYDRRAQRDWALSNPIFILAEPRKLRPLAFNVEVVTYIGIDVAREGSDTSVWVEWKDGKFSIREEAARAQGQG